MEREVYFTFLKQLALPEEALKRLAEKVNTHLDAVCAALRSIQEPANRESVARVFCLIIAAVGELQAAEQEVLARLLEPSGRDICWRSSPRWPSGSEGRMVRAIRRFSPHVMWPIARGPRWVRPLAGPASRSTKTSQRSRTSQPWTSRLR
jgi:hypothetical protein